MNLLFVVALALLLLCFVIVLILGFYLWRTKQHLWVAYDSLEIAVEKLRDVLDDVEKAEFEELFRDIEKHLREE